MPKAREGPASLRVDGGGTPKPGSPYRHEVDGWIAELAGVPERTIGALVVLKST